MLFSSSCLFASPALIVAAVRGQCVYVAGAVRVEKASGGHILYAIADQMPLLKVAPVAGQRVHLAVLVGVEEAAGGHVLYGAHFVDDVAQDVPSWFESR